MVDLQSTALANLATAPNTVIPLVLHALPNLPKRDALGNSTGIKSAKKAQKPTKPHRVSAHRIGSAKVPRFHSNPPNSIKPSKPLPERESAEWAATIDWMDRWLAGSRLAGCPSVLSESSFYRTANAMPAARTSDAGLASSTDLLTRRLSRNVSLSPKFADRYSTRAGEARSGGRTMQSWS